jgi:hypothetical protein
MDSTPHLLSLVSKFPSGIRGIDLRFALRIQKPEFVRLAQSSLIDRTISLTDNDLSDFEEGKFKLSANLYFERAEQTPVPKIVCDLHEALQKRPQGLSIHELHNQTHHSIPDLERQIFIEKDFGFVQVKTDEHFHTKYQTNIQEVISRLVDIEPEPQLPTLYTRGTVLSVSAIGTLILGILSKLIFF